MIKTFYIFSFFLGQSRSLSSVSKKQILEICFQFASLMAFCELWTIRTLANSALVNSDPKKFGPSQIVLRPPVNSDPDHWSIRTLFNWSIRTSKRKILWSIRTFSLGQFGPFPLVNSDLFPLVNSDLFHWSIRTIYIMYFP